MRRKAFDRLIGLGLGTDDEKRYTVKNKDYSLDEKIPIDDPCENFWLCAAKWFLAILITLFLFFCVISSKICLLVLGERYRDLERRDKRSATNSTNGTSAANATRSQDFDTNPEGNSKESLVVMLVLVLLIPQGVSLLLAFWTSARRKSHPWPTGRAVGAVRFLFFPSFLPSFLPSSLPSFLPSSFLLFTRILVFLLRS